LRSQPFAGLPSQSANPALQAARTQFEARHAPVALLNPQALPQKPQLLASEARLVSHPSAGLLLQFANPGSQAPTLHTEAVQAPKPWATAGQTLPHAPQLLRSEVVLVSHPFEGLPSQLPKPAVQVAWPHTPPMQAAEVLAPEGQVMVQPPQLAGSLWRSTQAPPQRVWPLTGQAHWPLTQAWAAGQATPQLPQLKGSAVTCASQPLVAEPSQLLDFHGAGSPDGRSAPAIGLVRHLFVGQVGPPRRMIEPGPWNADHYGQSYPRSMEEPGTGVELSVWVATTLVTFPSASSV
jgi:hypothetical protein